MIDGLGLVFEKQGNTGAAAYNQPSLGIGQNPLDRIAADIEQQKNIVQQNNIIQDRQNEKLNKDFMNLGGDGWYKHNLQIGNYIKAGKDRFAQLYAEGVRPSDFQNPKAREFYDIRQGLDSLINTSKSLGKQFEDTKKMLIGDLNSPNPQFEHEATLKKLQEWENLPLEEQLKTPIESALVKKEVPFDMYAPIKDVKIDDFVGKIDSENPNMASSRTELNDANLKSTMTAVANNPANEQAFQIGKSKGLWDTKEEYAQVLYDKKKLEFTKNTSYTKKAPPGGYTRNYINGKGANDLLGQLGYGTQSINVPVLNAKDKFVPIAYKFSTQLGNVDAVVAKQSIIDAKTGELIGGSGNMALKSGSIVLTPVYKGTNRPYPLTPDMSQKKLVEDGKIEWKPMVSGKASEKDDLGTETEKDVWIPADAILHGTGDSNKALSAGEAAYYIYQKKADELNKGDTQASLKGGQNKPATQKNKNPNYKGDRIKVNGFEYVWNPKTNTYE